MMEDGNRTIPPYVDELIISVAIIQISNNYHESLTAMDEGSSFHKIVFQIEDKLTDELAVSVLFTLFIMSFQDAGLNKQAEKEIFPDDRSLMSHFMDHLELNPENGKLCLSCDHVLGRSMKTDIIYEFGGKVTLITRNRGKSAERWLKAIGDCSRTKDNR